jgi:hypothetical protein
MEEDREMVFAEKYWELVTELASADMNHFKKLTKWARNFVNIMEENNDGSTSIREETGTKEPSRIITLSKS